MRISKAALVLAALLAASGAHAADRSLADTLGHWFKWNSASNDCAYLDANEDRIQQEATEPCLTGGMAGGSSVKVAEGYPGADFSDQVQAAQDASPVGGTILITESHTLTGTIDLDQPNTTIVCEPGVVLTQGGAAQTTFSITAANTTIRGCTMNGQKNALAASGIKISVDGDGALIESNYIYDYRSSEIWLNPAASASLLEHVTIRGNRIANNVATPGSVTTASHVTAALGTNVSDYKVIDNHIVSRGDGGTPLFLFSGIVTRDVSIEGNHFEAEGDAGLAVNGCMEVAVASGGSISHPDDYMTGLVVANNTCDTYDFTAAGMGIGMARGGSFTGNVSTHLGSTQGYPTIASVELGNLYQVAVTGNTFISPLSNGVHMHDVQHVTFSGNIVEHGFLTGLGYGLRILRADTLDPAVYFADTEHITVTGNVFRVRPGLVDAVDLHSVYVYCDGDTFTGMTIDDVVISGNTMIGAGSPGSVSGAVGLHQQAAQGRCVINTVVVDGNSIDNWDHQLWTNNHIYSDLRLTNNHATNIAVSPILVGNASSTGFYVNGQGAEPPVTGAQCANGSIWMDTDTATDAICATAANGDLCTCAGAAWTAVE